MKILNLYAGIGGNRKKWGGHQITAVEFDPAIARIYADLYPSDTIIVGDAHRYLLDHCSEFDFIWSSPPCPSHSITNFYLNKQGVVRYPDMKLYQEIIYLKHFFKGLYVVENVKSYYTPLVNPQVSGRHYFWANFKIPTLINRIKINAISGKEDEKGNIGARKAAFEMLGFDLSKYSYPKKEKLLRNCVDPDIGLAILSTAIEVMKHKNTEQLELF